MRNITELLNIKYPILQGGMANVADATLASAVSNAGGLGLIACSAHDAEWVRTEIRKARTLTDKPFGVNVMMMSPHVKDIMEVLVQEKVAVVTTGAGNPAPYIPSLKEVGTIVIPVIPSVALAIRMERAGADAVVAEGTEAGGHIGELTTMALIPQVADAVSIPVIAAGGIGDFRGVLAAFALGAKGVQAGTIFLATKECPVHDNYKQMVVDAKDTSTVVTGRNTGAPVRVLKNIMATEYLQMSNTGASRDELEKLTLGSLRRAVSEGDVDRGSFMAGQISGLVKEVKTVKQVIEDLFNPIEAYKDTLGI